MPTPLLKALYKKVKLKNKKITKKRVQDLWEQAQELALKKFPKNHKGFYPYTVGILKKSLGIKKEITASVRLFTVISRDITAQDLRRKLDNLTRLINDKAVTPGEKSAAQEAFNRLSTRLSSVNPVKNNFDNDNSNIIINTRLQPGDIIAICNDVYVFLKAEKRDNRVLLFLYFDDQQAGKVLSLDQFFSLHPVRASSLDPIQLNRITQAWFKLRGTAASKKFRYL